MSCGLPAPDCLLPRKLTSSPAYLLRDAGRFLNDRLLRHGSSRPAAPLLAELVGGKLDPSYYLQQLFR